MNAHFRSFGLIVVSLLVLADSTARADRAPPRPPEPAEATAPAPAPEAATEAAPATDAKPNAGQVTFHQAACRGKNPRQLCDLEQGAAGTCVPVDGPAGKAVLQCLPAPNDPPFEQGPMVMLMFGILVALIGGFFWFRLKRNWGKP